MRIPSVIVAAFFISPVLAQVKKGDTYKSLPYDSTYGITRYEKLNFYLGGDSVRYDKKGYSASGWYEDYYENGQVCHKGYYVEGHLKVYTNYFPDGKVERTFKSEFNKASMKIYWPNGNPHAEIEYLNGVAMKETDYYENGQMEFQEEYNKDGQYIIRKFFYPDGSPQSLLELIDPKKKLYASKEYHDNGNPKEIGQMVYKPGAGDYQKEGKWLIYDESGKLVLEQFYSKGELANEKKF
ncbi:MAG: hypothetical protein AB1458_16365 [Bacteroidota bacterium]